MRPLSSWPRSHVIHVVALQCVVSVVRAPVAIEGIGDRVYASAASSIEANGAPAESRIEKSHFFRHLGNKSILSHTCEKELLLHEKVLRFQNYIVVQLVTRLVQLQFVSFAYELVYSFHVSVGKYVSSLRNMARVDKGSAVWDWFPALSE